MYRLADYLEQHGRHERRYTCPPASFWETAARTAPPDELTAFARAAHACGRYRHAEHLAGRAADAGNTDALWALAQMREEAEDRDGTEQLYRQAAAGDGAALDNLARVMATDQHPASEILRYGWEPDGSISPHWHPKTPELGDEH
ncbi:hypothetical protein [Embleya hyalina]|uniref:Sel1 repeat family protein n=1 Tax=Embleya hyalina TaxID=516124 RepID=A0A401Z2H6_9ACTN|nr:hypothetical protein [Embleya hyalina]GCE01059.1 hypothetical protein EHYA_08798 [Embleya hyalina]